MDDDGTAQPAAPSRGKAKWPEIKAWRRATRAALIADRVRMSRRDRERRAAAVLEHLSRELPPLDGAVVGFYWAFKGEIDVRGVVRALIAGGARAALPVVIESATPLEFWAWQPRMKMARGVWNIPIPGERAPLQPDLLIVPLVGFDAGCYRLGYGGGYYDRTVAAMRTRPRCIGIGFEQGRLDSIAPQPHDIPMDAIVTEDGAVWRGGRLSP